MAFPLAELRFAPHTDDEPSPPRLTRGHDETITDLVQRLRNGDGRAFEETIRRYYTWLHGVALGYVASPAAAEEIADDVLARLWERRGTLTEDTNLAVYLFVAIRHASLDRVKHETRAARQLRLADHSEEYPGLGVAPVSPDIETEQLETVRLVWEAIDTLPERTRAVMVLRWREQLDWADVAAAMGTSVGAAQMLHTRALKALRTILPEHLTDS